ncbi:MAG: hypothetical protein ACRYGI_18685 [Janthinobacterium lividum]
MHLSLYWVYDLPNWLFGALTIFVFVIFGVAGLVPTRNWVRRQHRVDHSHNDIVGYYLAAITVFYGITLGLVAVGTWTSYSDADSKVDREAEVLGSLYRDTDGYPDPLRGILEGDLRAYTRYVIDISWPQQRRGIVPVGSMSYLEHFQKNLLKFEPVSGGQQVLHAETYRKFNDLVEARRARLSVVTAGLPGSLWSLVILGAVISIAVTLFFDTPSFSMHFWMTALMSALLGLMIFLVGTLDNPFRGEVSVSPDALEVVYLQTMNGK